MLQKVIYVVLIIGHISTSYAIVTTVPSPGVKYPAPPPTTITRDEMQPQSPQVLQQQQRSKTSSLRIRSTTENELNDISSLLASASITTTATNSLSRGNWNNAIQQLRVKHALETQLQHRWKAIEAGRNAASIVRATLVNEGQLLGPTTTHANNLNIRQQSPSLSSLFDHEIARRLLWSNDNFKTKLSKAVHSTVEKHGWGEGYNFNVMPNNSNLLQHAMITAYDVDRGCIIGFCEVAMLSPPLSTSMRTPWCDSYIEDDVETCLLIEDQQRWHYDDQSHRCVPMIVNLVTCPNYRRRGIATSLIKSVDRFVRTKWSIDEKVDELGLYVDVSNTVAISLYEKEGFTSWYNYDEKNQYTTDENGKCYLSRPFSV